MELDQGGAGCGEATQGSGHGRTAGFVPSPSASPRAEEELLPHAGEPGFRKGKGWLSASSHMLTGTTGKLLKDPLSY